MFKPKFSVASLVVMVVMTVVASFRMIAPEGTGFEIKAGFPFNWYHWADYKHASPYNFLAIVGDVLFWLAIVFGAGLLTEKIIKRF